MEEITNPDLPIPEPQKGCINCGDPHIIEGYPNALCSPCRQAFTKLSVPLWVKLFGGFVLLLLLVSLFEIPRNFSTAISLERAEKAEKQGNYITAQRELEKVISNAPNSLEVSGHLLIASFYNNDFTTLGKMANGLANKTFDDTVLVNQINRIEKQANSYFPTDSFQVVIKQYPKGVNAIPGDVFKNYVSKFTGDTFANYSYAATFFTANNYPECDHMLSSVINYEADYMPALLLKSIVKRELNQLDSSLFYCDKLLFINHQYPPALSSKVRTILKQGKKTEGLKMAIDIYSNNNTEPYTLATLALAYHVNGKTAERDAIISRADKDSVNASYMSYVKDVISGRSKFN